MSSLYVINIKPDHWEICRENTAYGIAHGAHTPFRTKGRWMKGDICLARVGRLEPKGVRAIWYIESEKLVESKADNLWKKFGFDCESRIQLRSLVEFKNPFSEEFEGKGGSKSRKVGMNAQRFIPSVIQFSRSEATNYMKPLIREKRKELITEVGYLGRKVRLDSLLTGFVQERHEPQAGSSRTAEITSKEQLIRKYGPGGESLEHKQLKRWILDHPAALGINRVVRGHPEYELPSGDRVDVVFDLPGNRHAVVEIETDTPLPGAYQALKYKVLKCAEIGLDIESTNVEAILVAWRKPDDADFLKKYGIRFFQKQL